MIFVRTQLDDFRLILTAHATNCTDHAQKTVILPGDACKNLIVKKRTLRPFTLEPVVKVDRI